MCGEHAHFATPSDMNLGSSPHVRGAYRFLQEVDREDGIIPACAGSMFVPCGFSSSTGDHPRMCGEHEELGVTLGPGQGSSPHVRGA